MTTTPNLGLTQYAGTDTMNFLTQYNTDLSKIDTTTGKLSNLTTTSKTNLVSATNENVTNIGTLASLKTAVKTSTVGAINEVYDTTDNGWISARATLTYASASAPTFVCNTSIDLTTRISVGMKIKLTQTTTKYFFVTAITSTTITLYGGTDYVLANATISNIYYSMVKSPHGFPMNPNKWSVKVINNTNSSITNLQSPALFPNVNITVPIGEWKFEISGTLNASTTVTTTTTADIGVTVQIVDSRIDPSFYPELKLMVARIETNATNPIRSFYIPFSMNSLLVTNSSVTLSVLVTALAVGIDTNLAGQYQPTIIKATCAYL